jgi:hypothetical protein
MPGGSSRWEPRIHLMFSTHRMRLGTVAEEQFPVEWPPFNANGVSEKSFVLKMVKPGRYEAALPPGVYDVFVSEASSTPTLFGYRKTPKPSSVFGADFAVHYRRYGLRLAAF